MAEEKQVAQQIVGVMGCKKSRYHSPKLVQFGSIATLTLGTMSGFEDVLNGGTGGTQNF